MFITAAKTAMVEALREALVVESPGPNFKTIDIEYPSQTQKLPMLLVQFEPSGDIEWTGINSEAVYKDQTGTPVRCRMGKFEGYFDLSIMAGTSEERDVLWDRVNFLMLLGRTTLDGPDFYRLINVGGLIGMTLLEGRVTQVGNTVAQGLPWDPQEYGYEATVRVEVIGQFAVNVESAELLTLSDIEALPYTDQDPIPGDVIENQFDDTYSNQYDGYNRSVHDSDGPWRS